MIFSIQIKYFRNRNINLNYADKYQVDILDGYIHVIAYFNEGVKVKDLQHFILNNNVVSVDMSDRFLSDRQSVLNFIGRL